MDSFETTRLLYAACAEARKEMMGMYTEGPFTRVAFVYRRADIDLIRDAQPDTKGVAVHVISTRW